MFPRFTWLLLPYLLAAGLVAQAGEIKTNEPKKDPAPSAADQIKALIPKAASSPSADWQALARDAAPSIEKMENQSLSMVLMSLDPKINESIEFETSNPAKLAMAISLSQEKGYGTMLQPEFITECKCTVKNDKAVGTVKFRAEGLYKGKLELTARRVDGSWQIDEFRIPDYGLRTKLGADGKWKKSKLLD